jgi:tetracycline resistance efflux pump
MEWLSATPPIFALLIALLTRNVYWALGGAILLSETLIAGFNPALGLLGSIDRGAHVFEDSGNTRILMFCLIIGALIAYLERANAFAAMVGWLTRSGMARGPRQAGFITALAGVIIFIETNVSLLATGLLGQRLFDRFKLSRAKLAYVIDSTCSPVSVLILLNGWGAFVLGLLAANGVEAPIPAMVQSIPLNLYAWLTVALVFFVVLSGRSFGPMRASDAAALSAPSRSTEETETSGSLSVFVVPMAILVGGSISFMVWTGGGNILEGSGSRSILWAVCLATLAAFLMVARKPSGRKDLVEVGFKGMGDLLPAVTIIFLALALGASLKALGTGAFIAQLASSLPYAWAIPAMLFVSASITSFTTGTSWGTYGIFIPIAVPLAAGAGIPLPLVLAAVLGGGVFGDHCSPISDTTIIASLAAGCDHLEHVRTQMPFALIAGSGALLFYLAAGLIA